MPRPDYVWSLDFQFDMTVNNRAIKQLNIFDEFARESLAIVVDRSTDAYTTATLEKNVVDRGRAPLFIHCDNGPELTAHALADRCKTSGAGMHCVNPCSPWQNTWTQSFNSRLRDKCLAVEEFTSLLEAQIVIADWRRDYRPRSACSPRPHSHHGNHNRRSHGIRTNNRVLGSRVMHHPTRLGSALSVQGRTKRRDGHAPIGLQPGGNDFQVRTHVDEHDL